MNVTTKITVELTPHEAMCISIALNDFHEWYAKDEGMEDASIDKKRAMPIIRTVVETLISELDQPTDYGAAT